MNRLEIAERILALPAYEQSIAIDAFRQLVETRHVQLPPTPRSPVDLAIEAGISPDPWQRQVLTSSAPKILLNCARQTGKSTITALLAIHTAYHEAESLTLLLSPSLRQSGELFKKALHIHRNLANPVPTRSESALRFELANGSRVVSLPGRESTVRGFSGVRLLAVDEAARVPDELYFALRPMLAISGGRLLALSTPFGTRGWWYQAWRSEEEWSRFKVPATQCPRISQEFLEEERRAMGEWWFDQEYRCQFLDAQTQPFRREDIDQAFAEPIESWDL